ncbi:sulfatase-like hydrolase/transferase [bacterium]|nr:sulfatase-like hydrolase/transferase [bacterium]
MGADDYELELAERGYAGQEFTHGMGNNNYTARPWHLPEDLHWTNWAVRHLCRTIKRRDPTRPNFWYLSFNHPHPPLVPLPAYLDMYRQADVPEPVVGSWATDPAKLPAALRTRPTGHPPLSNFELLEARRAFYALCTHIDHQLRLVIGMLREEDLLDDTIILFTSDHGDLLGNHHLYAKGLMYEDSTKVPMILVPAANDQRVGHHRTDDRLVELRDVFPTLLDLAGVPIPESVEGISMVAGRQRRDLYGEIYTGLTATRMIRDQRYKLIWYPVGNRVQLFDLQRDPDECRDLARQKPLQAVRRQLTARLIKHLYGEDSRWVKNGRLIGEPDQETPPRPNRGLFNQRGWRFMGGTGSPPVRI